MGLPVWAAPSVLFGHLVGTRLAGGTAQAFLRLFGAKLPGWAFETQERYFKLKVPACG